MKIKVNLTEFEPDRRLYKARKGKKFNSEEDQPRVETFFQTSGSISSSLGVIEKL